MRLADEHNRLSPPHAPFKVSNLADVCVHESCNTFCNIPLLYQKLLLPAAVQLHWDPSYEAKLSLLGSTVFISNFKLTQYAFQTV